MQIHALGQGLLCHRPQELNESLNQILQLAPAPPPDAQEGAYY
jgi:hypothetical protein